MGHSAHCGHLHDCAISVTRLAVIGICCCCLQLWTTVRATSLEEELYAEVASSFEEDIIRIEPDLQIFIDQIFKRVRCGNPDNPAGCLSPKCLNSTSAFQAAGYLPGTTVLTSQTFSSTALPILYYTLHLKQLCDISSNVTSPCLTTDLGQKRQNCWISNLLSNGTSFSEGEVDALLQSLSTTYDPKDGRNGSPEVLSAVAIVRERLRVPVGQPLKRDKVSQLASVILNKLFEGVPRSSSSANHSQHIRREHSADVASNYPDKFIAMLADLGPGDNISLDRIMDIMNGLKIGNSSHRMEDGNFPHLADVNHHDHEISKRQTPEERPLNLNESCWPLTELLKVYNLRKSALTKPEFEKLCPALIQQAYSGACRNAAPTKIEPLKSQSITDAEKYGYGTLAVVIISLVSVVGIIFLPFLRKQIYTYALQGFIALGVGTLCGDALLHLLPEALHVEEDEGHEHEVHNHDQVILWRCVACLGAIYVFFLWEICLHYFVSMRKRRAPRSAFSTDGHGANGDCDSNGKHDHSHIPDPETFTNAIKNGKLSSKTNVELQAKDDHVHGQNHEHNHETKDKFLGLSPLAWMILLGDAIHNFGDGLTIAAAFSVDARSGLSTSIAIFCHEIPHELGDFAILLSTGMSFKKAIGLNFLSALTCLIGFYVGVPIASYESARQWIFVVAAGMFLYVALADMLPELKHGATNLLTLFLQNLGLIIGVAVMVLMALFEDQIRV